MLLLRIAMACDNREKVTDKSPTSPNICKLVLRTAVPFSKFPGNRHSAFNRLSIDSLIALEPP